MFLLSLLLPLLNWLLVFSPLNAEHDVMATANNILAHELRYRIGLAVELAFAASVTVLALCFYLILRAVNKTLALLALYWKLAEAILVAASVLVTVLALQVLKGRTSLSAFNPEQLQDLVGLFLNVRHAGSFVSVIFLSLGSTVFFYLFLKSRYMPRLLAGFGILSYSLLLLTGVRNILAPDSATTLTLDTLQLIGFIPSCLAEAVIGSWLMVKGVDVPRQDSPRLGLPELDPN
jgi:hypothetical protein